MDYTFRGSGEKVFKENKHEIIRDMHPINIFDDLNIFYCIRYIYKWLIRSHVLTYESNGNRRKQAHLSYSLEINIAFNNSP